MRAALRQSAFKLLSAIMACIILSGGIIPVAGQEQSNDTSLTFRIKPSDVAVPDDVPMGQYRRIVQPFENWTMICDENLKARQRVCNIGQAIVDAAGKMAFSWSLAATHGGKPFLILRTGPDAKPDRAVQVRLPGRKQPVGVAVDGCNDQVCVARTPVGAVFREHIDKQSGVGISYETTDGCTVTIPATFKGLPAALSAIN